MAFGDENWDKLLAPYLSSDSKDRLKDALTQFKPEHRNGGISYQDFYYNYGYSFFLQGDLVYEVKTANWNAETKGFEKKYIDGIILSNSCDISFENKRDLNPKQCLFAPLIPFEDYIKDLLKDGYSEEKVNAFKINVYSQSYSNIFFLPKNSTNEQEYIALFDQIFWLPIDELIMLSEDIRENRIVSLNQYGFYLFILKLSYHLCRLPEACDRESIL